MKPSESVRALIDMIFRLGRTIDLIWNWLNTKIELGIASGTPLGLVGGGLLVIMLGITIVKAILR
jgi:hypothetical protein